MFKFMYILMLSITLSHADAMKSDSAHKKKEDYISTLTYAQMKKMDHGDAIRWLITPKLRLTKEDLADLQKGSLIQVVGNGTTATLTAIEWNGDLSMLTSGADLLMEKVLYNPEKNTYIAIYRYPKDSKSADKGVKVELLDIKVNDPNSEIGKFLIDLISHPGFPGKTLSAQSAVPQSVQIIQPSSSQAAMPQTVVTQAQSPVVIQTVPQSQTVIVEEVRRPYYGPYLYPGVVVGGWGHRRHW
jgi:hypothetical protein